MYSTNLHLSEGGGNFIWDDKGPVGTAFGWEDTPTQTAKDNALLWSLAPEMVELLQVWVDNITEVDAWDDTAEEIDSHYRKCVNLLDKLAQAIPPASVAQNG